jgi:hypothetical protein
VDQVSRNVRQAGFACIHEGPAHRTANRTFVEFYLPPFLVALHCKVEVLNVLLFEQVMNGQGYPTGRAARPR